MMLPDRSIALDARMIGHSGIGAHIRGLLEGWRETAPDFRPTLLGDPARLSAEIPDAAQYPIVPFRAPIYGLREQALFPSSRTRGALLHSPHYNIPLRHAGPLAVTIHDLIHLDRQWGPYSPVRRFYARWMLRTAVRRARHIFTVSQATADDLAGRLGVGRNKISVVYNAPSRLFVEFDPQSAALEQFRRQAGLPADYLLTVGLYKPHKNLDVVLEAFRLLAKGGNCEVSLVIAGTQDKERAALRNRLAKLEIADRVRVPDRLPAAQLPLLYAAARVLIHPSLREGFGLPIVEAQAVGTPVVASELPVLREVAGEGAMFFDPYDATALASQIETVAKDSEIRSRLIAAGRRNAARFSWRESAQKVLAVYERIV